MPIQDAEVERYARQLLLPGMGKVPQEFLKVARVQVVGGGPVAGPALLCLTQAGIGQILVDDGGDVAPEDAAGWIYPPGRAGEARAPVAVEALRAANAFSRPRLFASGAEPTAVLICAGGALAREAAERAREQGLPHVVATGDGDGGAVISVPVGAPCYACAFRVGTGQAPPPATAAALGALAAAELVLMITGTAAAPQGRRIELALGHPQAHATVRQPGCRCRPRTA
jgi:molybdopterin-synthase adenylyltransferase